MTKTAEQIEKPKTVQSGQFEFSGEMASLQTRQAAAFNYMKGYMQEAFRCKEGLNDKDIQWMDKRIREQFNIDLKIEK